MAIVKAPKIADKAIIIILCKYNLIIIEVDFCGQAPNHIKHQTLKPSLRCWQPVGNLGISGAPQSYPPSQHDTTPTETPPLRGFHATSQNISYVYFSKTGIILSNSLQEPRTAFLPKGQSNKDKNRQSKHQKQAVDNQCIRS